MCIRDRLDDRLLNTPAVAVERARAATAEMAELARVGVVQAMSLTHEWNNSVFNEKSQILKTAESLLEKIDFNHLTVRLLGIAIGNRLEAVSYTHLRA